MKLNIKKTLQQAIAAHKEGKLQDAERLYLSILQSYPNHPEANQNLGVLETNKLIQLFQNSQYDEAIKLGQSLTERFPKHQFAWKILGVVLGQTGRHSEALNASQTAAALPPQDAQVHYNLGVTLKELGRLDEAEVSYRQAIALQPGYAQPHNNLGVTLQELGRLDEAEASYRQAIDLQPDNANAHRHLTLMKKFESQDEQFLKMQELYLDENTTEKERYHINFGLAKACEDLGDFKKAFIHYSEGNALRKKLLNYDTSQDEELFKQIKSNYRQIKQNTLKSEKLEKSLIPIFIVGMPRSGTTLVEQIISSHSQVTGAGELAFIRKFGNSISTGLSQVSTEILLKFRQQYLSECQKISKDNKIVTDKMPHNFLYIGLIATAFPEAKIVHVKRDPAAVSWANFKQYFSSKELGYCYALDDIISYYGLYENLMEFWESSLGKIIYNLDYELLIVNQENETRNLIEFLGLGWDEKCLSPQNNTRGVSTASNTQVRKKVYQGSSQQWKKYEPFLSGAFDIFK